MIPFQLPVGRDGDFSSYERVAQGCVEHRRRGCVSGRWLSPQIRIRRRSERERSHVLRHDIAWHIESCERRTSWWHLKLRSPKILICRFEGAIASASLSLFAAPRVLGLACSATCNEYTSSVLRLGSCARTRVALMRKGSSSSFSLGCVTWTCWSFALSCTIAARLHVS